LNNRNEAAPQSQKRGDVAAAFASSAHVFEDRYSTTFVHNAQMEPRAAVAHWEGDKLTVYTPTGGIANCRHDMARDLGIADDKVRVVCQYMGGTPPSRRTRMTSRALSPNPSRAKVATGTSGPSSSPRCGTCATNTTPC
jgi:xanthine dehydrogenase YagR molybdenum-binding subunit